MKSLQKSGPAQSLAVFMIMMLSGNLLFTAASYIKACYLGGDWIWCETGAFFSAMMLFALLAAMRDMRRAAYQDRLAGREEVPPSPISVSEIGFAASYIYAAGFAFYLVYPWFHETVIPLGAKVLLGSVVAMFALFSGTNLYQTCLRWRESRKMRELLPARQS